MAKFTLRRQHGHYNVSYRRFLCCCVDWVPSVITVVHTMDPLVIFQQFTRPGPLYELQIGCQQEFIRFTAYTYTKPMHSCFVLEASGKKVVFAARGGTGTCHVQCRHTSPPIRESGSSMSSVQASAPHALCALASAKEAARQSTWSAHAAPRTTRSEEALPTSEIRRSMRKAILSAIVASFALCGKSARARSPMFSAAHVKPMREHAK